VLKHCREHQHHGHNRHRSHQAATRNTGAAMGLAELPANRPRADNSWLSSAVIFRFTRQRIRQLRNLPERFFQLRAFFPYRLQSRIGVIAQFSTVRNDCGMPQ
jgi:hypothetical protein